MLLPACGLLAQSTHLLYLVLEKCSGSSIGAAVGYVKQSPRSMAAQNLGGSSPTLVCPEGGTLSQKGLYSSCKI